MKEIFKKDIDRDINGVIKVGQLSEADVTQELEEYVMTSELGGYFDAFYRRFVESLSASTDKIGVWISGFFGSGKSHFLKILSYLLKNEKAGGKSALAYFKPKVQDSMLYAAMERAGEAPKDVILFNIDSRADAISKSAEEAIVEVFMRVFNEHLGYFGASLAVADFERRIDKDGKYQAFKDAYEKSTGKKWEDDRENWDFREDEIVSALQAALGQSEDAARGVFERIEEGYSLSVHRFATIVKEYLDTKPKNHQVIFMVDEVGQYIGEDSRLMLNLQTIVEDLGTSCEGHAWVIVTSQEDIDSITQNRVKGNDFSKIQGRFKTRLSLSSANTDEVIKLRLLEKTDDAAGALRALYSGKDQILKNQIRFSSGTAEMPGYLNVEDFVTSYPFVPYQFKLLQKVFTQIRLHGASGKHLSQGERSMLDAFQLAAQQVKAEPLGTLAPFHSFYRAIEGFLDAAVKSVITQAADNKRLQPFDVELLKTLFMIKYVKELKGAVENLTTLSLGNIDEDRLALQTKIKGALNRLERETLVQRNGDVYEFLTNEEQDIGREIKNFTINPGEAQVELQKIVWEDIFTTKKYRYDARHDYGFNRMLDGQVAGSQTDDLTLHIVTPRSDDYGDLKSDANAMLRSGSGIIVLVRLPDDSSAFTELTQYVKTDRYVKQKNRDGLSPSVRDVLHKQASENQERRRRLVEAIARLIAGADVFVCGSKLATNGGTPDSVLLAGLKTLVDNTYAKLHYVRSAFTTDEEIEQVLRDGLGAVQADTDGQVPNGLAQTEMHAWLGEQRDRHQTVTLRNLEERFGKRPYGWARRDIQGVLAELLAQGKAELRRAHAGVDLRERNLVRTMSSRPGLDAFTVRVPRTVNPEALRVARELAQQYLGSPVVPSEPQALYDYYRRALETKAHNTSEHLAVSQQGDYPFRSDLDRHRQLLATLLAASGAASFFEELREHEDAFEQLCTEAETIESFFRNQLDIFDKARQRLDALAPELPYITGGVLLRKVERAREILGSDDPTKAIPELAMLLAPVEEKATEVREARRQEASRAWHQACTELTAFADNQGIAEHDRLALSAPLTSLQDQITAANSIDAIIARQASIEGVKQQVREQLIERLNGETAGGATAKQIRTLHPASFATDGLLESEADVKAYLTALEAALLAEVYAGYKVLVE